MRIPLSLEMLLFTKLFFFLKQSLFVPSLTKNKIGDNELCSIFDWFGSVADVKLINFNSVFYIFERGG